MGGSGGEAPRKIFVATPFRLSETWATPCSINYDDPIEYPTITFSRRNQQKIAYASVQITKFIGNFCKSSSWALELPAPSLQGPKKLFFEYTRTFLLSYLAFLQPCFNIVLQPSLQWRYKVGEIFPTAITACCQLPLQAWFTSFRKGLLPNRHRFTDFKQSLTGSRKSLHRFTQPLLVH